MDSPSEVNAEADAATLLTSVFSALADRADKDVFAIGGKIDITNPASASTVGHGPLVIRWDSGKWDQGRKITLPVDGDAASERAFTWLLKDSEPATFGLGDKEVLDETYRKAAKMDVTKFCTNFSPYEHGVMYTVIQALVHNSHPHAGSHGVRAELYKLNIYSGPSGKFKSHVDTPRSEEQMGSLVVCLPYPHQGGGLEVRHRGRKVLFDWASKEPSAIKWAAFFSDCEHEVFEVTEGHRVTLTYNLYWTAYGPASMADHLGALEPESLHFFAALEKLLACPTFLQNGGVLGFTCTHAYPHTSKSSVDDLHHTLKGLDMVVYQALKRLTGSVQVATVLDDDKYQSWKRERGYRDYSDEQSETDDEAGDIYTSDTLLGESLGSPTLWRDYEEEGQLDPESIVRYVRPSRGSEWQAEQIYSRQKVTWLNDSPGSEAFKELAVAFLTYGNQPGIDAYYSSAVIVAPIDALDDSK